MIPQSSTTFASCRRSCCPFRHDHHVARSADGRAARARRRSASDRAGRARLRPSPPPFIRRRYRRASRFLDMVRVDSFSIFFHFLVIAITAVVILSFLRIHGSAADSGRRILRTDPVWRGRHGLMSSAVELVLIFIALEISSISTYILAGFRRRAAISSEVVGQVFPARLFCHRILSLWRGADVRSDRLDQH